MSAELVEEFKRKIRRAIKFSRANYYGAARKVINQAPDELKEELTKYAGKRIDKLYQLDW